MPPKGHEVMRRIFPPKVGNTSTVDSELPGRALKALERRHSLWPLAALQVVALCWGRASEVLSLRRDRDVFLDQDFAIIRDHQTLRAMGAKRLGPLPSSVAIFKKLPKDRENPFFFPGQVKNRLLSRD
jgi:hypothetical protein